jgi:hypothetical protein
MKTKLFSLIALSFSLFLFSCNEFDNHVKPNNKITTTQATYSDYDMIDASSAFTVYVTFSDEEESIEIEANDNLHQYIEVKKENDVLRIGLNRNVHIRGSATLTAYITTKNVSEYMASGASRIIVESRIEATDANIYLSGASTFSGELVVDNFITDLSGASNLNIQGFAQNFEAEASGASVMQNYGFETNRLKADLSGASNMYVTVGEGIDVEASGASVLYYKGSAVITGQDLSGASSIREMN